MKVPATSILIECKDVDITPGDAIAALFSEWQERQGVKDMAISDGYWTYWDFEDSYNAELVQHRKVTEEELKVYNLFLELHRIF